MLVQSARRSRGSRFLSNSHWCWAVRLHGMPTCSGFGFRQSADHCGQAQQGRSHHHYLCGDCASTNHSPSNASSSTLPNSHALQQFQFSQFRCTRLSGRMALEPYSARERHAQLSITNRPSPRSRITAASSAISAIPIIDVSTSTAGWPAAGTCCWASLMARRNTRRYFCRRPAPARTAQRPGLDI